MDTTTQAPENEVEVSQKGTKLKCYRRTQFLTMTAAQQEVNRFKQFEVVPYKCRWCNYFHVFFT